MRGRKPERFQLKPRETAWLRKLLRAGKTPWRIAGRTQILLPCAEKSQPVGSWSQKLAQSASTSWRIGKPPYRMPLDQVGDAFFPRGQRKDIERLSRREPESVGRPAPHGSFRSWAEATVEQGSADAIAYTTVREILDAAKMRLPLFRFWKTPVWDDEAVARALKILWEYERVESLGQRGEVVLAADAKPNLQVLERKYPKQPPIERVEFDYKRHGTIHFLAECWEKNAGDHFRPAIQRFLPPIVGHSAFT